MIMLLPGKPDFMPTCSKCNTKDTPSLIIYINLPGISKDPKLYFFRHYQLTTVFILRMKRFSPMFSKDFAAILMKF